MSHRSIRTWFVTGASDGVGREVCRQLLEKGCNVIAVARRIPEFGGDNALSLSADVTRPESIARAVEEGIARFGSIDVLMNNAGISDYATCEETSAESMRRVMEVNFYGAFHTMQALLPHFRAQQHGAIINNTSHSGLTPRSYGAAYCASKHALEGLTSSVWHDARRFCRVMAVELGFFPGTGIAKPPPGQVTKYEEYEGIPPFYKRFSRSFRNDLETAVAFIISVAEKDKWPRRLMLGKDALIQIDAELNSIRSDWHNARPMALKCSIPTHDPNRVKFCGLTIFKKKDKGAYTRYCVLGFPFKVRKQV